MANMSYCKFENTFNDLNDCLTSLENSSIEELEENASTYEKSYIRKLINLCTEISQNYDQELDDEFLS